MSLKLYDNHSALEGISSQCLRGFERLGEHGDFWFARLNEDREVHIIEKHQSHFYEKSTVIKYSWWVGEGMPVPTCAEKEAAFQNLVRKL